jgi:bisphosphoglycerate-dependent phosphoglycerate mutase family 1
MELGQEYIPVYKSYRLNERHYGDLVGRNKKEAVMMYGKDQVKRWRRSYDEPPPEMALDHPYNPAMDPRYRLVRMVEPHPLASVCATYFSILSLTFLFSFGSSFL